ncbi:YceI family protein [Allokutzneria albata]|uniref:Polyisoprenoid-binding protein YceI n=1 Tax=Allokutzneria albata TaxID=211114 RepID=A0A1H0CDN5_ALLAB|nr:YceI family protein [Allokutzneria albata]SDN56004.1 Polyisoprenoid-binding protein YceI [Allokutzneria albata]
MTAPAIAGYRSGFWTIDQEHSSVLFTARHMAVGKVHGRFRRFVGKVFTGETVEQSAVRAIIDATSLDTGSAKRDRSLASSEFLESETYPTMEFRSSAVHPYDTDFLVDGELAMHGHTRPVRLKLTFNGIIQDPYTGDTRAGFSAHTTIRRREFGLTFDARLPGGGQLVSDQITITLDIEATLDAPEPG